MFSLTCSEVAVGDKARWVRVKKPRTLSDEIAAPGLVVASR